MKDDGQDIAMLDQRKRAACRKDSGMFVKQGGTHPTHLNCELWFHKCLAQWLTQSSGCNYGKNSSIA